MAQTQEYSHADYTVAWICALPIEMAAAKATLDEIHDDLVAPINDDNAYILGKVGKHNVVVAGLPSGKYGTTSAAVVATKLLTTFSSIRFGLMVGIGGAVPRNDVDIRLGDVVVSKPSGKHGGVVQYDYGKALNGKFEQTGVLNSPPHILLTALTKLQTNHMTDETRIPEFLSRMEKKLGRKASNFSRPNQEDILFQPDYNHAEQATTCEECNSSKIVTRSPREYTEPEIHYGLIASGNSLVKNTSLRDLLGTKYGAYCVEMEAAGLMGDFPCVVIRGISDYADTHKNKAWQGYAAAVAAAFAKELLSVVPASSVDGTSTAQDVLANSRLKEKNAELERELKQKERDDKARQELDMMQKMHSKKNAELQRQLEQRKYEEVQARLESELEEDRRKEQERRRREQDDDELRSRVGTGAVIATALTGGWLGLAAAAVVATTSLATRAQRRRDEEKRKY